MGLKYWGEYRDVNGLVFRAEIVVDSFNGVASEMCFAEEAIKISYPEKEIHEPIFSCGASLHVRCTEAWQYLDLFSTSERSSRVIIYRARKVIFHGYVEPNLYESEWRKPPYTITIPATDGLAALENYTPEIGNEFGMVELMKIIKSCLAETRLNLPIMVCCKLVEGDPELITGTIFEGMYIEGETIKSVKNGIYESDNSHKILSDVLRQFNCRIYQANNTWYIERVKDKCTGSGWWRYEVDGSVSRVNVDFAITLDTDNLLFVGQPASVQIDSGYGKQVIKCDADRYESVIFNNYSAGIEFVPKTDTERIGKTKRWWRSRYVTDTGYPTGIKSIVNKVGISQGFVIDHAINDYEYVYQHSLITFIPKCTLNLKFTAVFKPASGMLKTRYRAKFVLALAPYDQYLQQSDVSSPDSYAFVHSPAPQAFGEGEITYFEFDEVDLEKPEEYYTVTFDEEIEHNFNYNCYPHIQFYGIEVNLGHEDYWGFGLPYISESYYGDVTLAITDESEYNNTFTGVVNSNYRREAPTLDVKFNTLPKVVTSGKPNCNISNGLYKRQSDGDYVAAEKVKEIGARGSMSVIEQLMVDNFTQYYDPRDIISGDVLTAEFVSPEMLFRMSGRDKFYLLAGCDYTTGEAQYTVKLEEIKNETVTVS